jgi:hypothetical protein
LVPRGEMMGIAFSSTHPTDSPNNIHTEIIFVFGEYCLTLTLNQMSNARVSSDTRGVTRRPERG